MDQLPDERGCGRLIGRTKGGMNTKLHAICNSQGRPLDLFVTAGQVSDYIGARALLSSLPKVDWLLWDRVELSPESGPPTGIDFSRKMAGQSKRSNLLTESLLLQPFHGDVGQKSQPIWEVRARPSGQCWPRRRFHPIGLRECPGSIRPDPKG